MNHKIFFLLLLTMQLVVKTADVPQAAATETSEAAEEGCMICYESLKDGRTTRTGICGAPNYDHTFHEECINPWLANRRHNDLCPKCKDKFWERPDFTQDELNLFEAAKSSNLEQLNASIAAGVDINVADEYGDTALVFACKEGHTNIFEALIEIPNIIITPKCLISAIFANSNEITRRLLGRPEIDVNAQDHYGNTAMSTACGYNNIEIISMLLEKPEININENFGEPLASAIFHDAHDAIRLLMTQQNLEISHRHLIAACESGNIELVKIFLEVYCMDPNKRYLINDIPSYPLLQAFMYNQYEVVKYLLSIPNININAKDDCGNTTLHNAISRRQYAKQNAEIIDLLLYDPKIDIGLENDLGETAEIIAEKSDNLLAHAKIILMKPFLNRASKKAIPTLWGCCAAIAVCSLTDKPKATMFAISITGGATLLKLSVEACFNLVNVIDMLKTNPDHRTPKKQAEIKRCLTIGCLTGLGSLSVLGIAALTIKELRK